MPFREERFRTMGDALDVLFKGPFTALDLGCGPGSLSVRMIERFPRVKMIGVDHDPVMLKIGQNALGDIHGHMKWIDADISSPGWEQCLGVSRFDAVLSTTAIHWLKPQDLRHLYPTLGKIVRKGGVFMNGDHFPFGKDWPKTAKLSDTWLLNNAKKDFHSSHAQNWDQWWNSIEKDPEFSSEFAERHRRYHSTHHSHQARLPPEAHARYLKAAGFREVAVIWQHLDNRVLMALR